MDLNDLIQFYLSLAGDFIGAREAVKELILKEWEVSNAPDATGILRQVK